jgi:hypothetical protein
MVGYFRPMVILVPLILVSWSQTAEFPSFVAIIRQTDPLCNHSEQKAHVSMLSQPHF